MKEAFSLLLGLLLSSAFLVASADQTPAITLNNGVRMPVIAAGTWQYNDTVAAASVAAAESVGFTHIDTAFSYFNEVGIGAALKKVWPHRDQYFLTTKVPGCGLLGVSRELCGADTLRAVNQNLKNLSLPYADLTLVHFPPKGGCGPLNCKIIQDQWSALSTIVKQNKSRAVGVSNFCISCLECLKAMDPPFAGVIPALNQVQFHVGMGSDPGGLLSYCKREGIVVEAYSPLGDDTKELISGKLTTSIGAKHNKSSVQVALKWIWQHGVTLTTKSSKAEHLAEDLELFDWSLSADEMAALDAHTTPAGTPSFMCTS